MAHQGANYIDLDVFAVGAVLPTLAGLFDQYWNSEHVYPLEAIVPPSGPAEARRRRFEEATLASRGPPLPPPGAKDLLGQLGIADELGTGRLELIWAKAEAFADSPDKVIDHSARVLGKPVSTDPTVRQSLMAELLRARQGVVISSPYLVPDHSVMEDIQEGRLWNLSITLITNSLASTDEPWVHAGYQRYRTEMLDLGVHLYEVAPSRIRSSKSLGAFGQSIGRFHGKAAAIDGELMFIGSLNFDPRSEKHNTELGFLIHSPELTGQLLKLAAFVINEAAFQVRLGPDRKSLEWHIRTDQGEQVFTEEPDTSWWQRTMLHPVCGRSFRRQLWAPPARDAVRPGVRPGRRHDPPACRARSSPSGPGRRPTRRRLRRARCADGSHRCRAAARRRPAAGGDRGLRQRLGRVRRGLSRRAARRRRRRAAGAGRDREEPGRHARRFGCEAAVRRCRHGG
jgi:putative cardiolipin synthase